MKMIAVMSLLLVACVGSAPPVRPGGPADPRAPEGPVTVASPELSNDSGIERYESGSAPMMGNMQTTDGGGMQPGRGGTQKGDMGNMSMDGGTR